jgi:hypothetical protein
MNNDIYTIRDWLEQSLINSDTNWYFSTFKVIGTYRDVLGVRRQIFNDLSEPKILRALDWTITNYRRTYKYQFRFVPFSGGSKELGINKHIHAFIELPLIIDESEFSKTIRNSWTNYLSKSLKCFCTSDVWFQKYDQSKGNAIRYCSRQEDISFFRELQGDSKVLVSSSSFLL